MWMHACGSPNESWHALASGCSRGWSIEMGLKRFTTGAHAGDASPALEGARLIAPRLHAGNRPQRNDAGHQCLLGLHNNTKRTPASASRGSVPESSIKHRPASLPTKVPCMRMPRA